MSNVDSNVPAGFQQIHGFPRYAISEDGTILSICGRGFGAQHDLPWSDAHKVTPFMVKGYQQLRLRGRNKVRQVMVHTLVLETFAGPRPKYCECRHLDGNKTNNNIANLVWGTRSENMQDRILHGAVPRGERHSFAKLTEADVLDIRQRRACGITYRVLASDFRVAIGTIWDAVQRNTWRHI
jgi:hypothetical protein